MTSGTRPHSTYHADCLCGKAITSETRLTKCEACGRLLAFEWGGETDVIEPPGKPAAKEKARGAGA